MARSDASRRIAVYSALAVALCVIALLLGLKLGARNSPADIALAPVPQSTPQSAPALAAQSSPQSQAARKGLYFPPGPVDGTDKARTAAQRFASGGEPHPPLHMYSLSAAAKAGLQPTDAWRYMYYAVNGDKTTAAVTVIFDPATNTSHMGSTAISPAPDIVQILDRLAELPRVRAGSFEARVLTFQTPPGNMYPVFWLRADSGPQDDLFYTFRTYYQSGIEPEKFYALEEIQNLLVPRRAAASTIAGTVVKTDGKPAGGARVTLTQSPAMVAASTTTDAAGAFTLDNVSSGVDFEIAAATDDQVSFPQSVRITGGKPIILPAPIQLTPGGTITGTVLRADGKPAGGATLSYSLVNSRAVSPLVIHFAGDGTFAEQTAAGRADGQGHFVIRGIVPGSYILAASLEAVPRVENSRQLGFAAPIDVGMGLNTTLPAPIGLAQTSSVSGSVCGPDDKPIANISIAFKGTWTAADSSSIAVAATWQAGARTSAAGAFTIHGMPPGTFTISASNAQPNGQGSVSTSLPVTLKPAMDFKLVEPIRMAAPGRGRGR